MNPEASSYNLWINSKPSRSDGWFYILCTSFGTWGRGETAYAAVQGQEMPPFSTLHAPPISHAHTDTHAPSPSAASASQQVGDRANRSSGAHQSRLLDEMQASQAGRPPRNPHLGVPGGAENVHKLAQVTGGHRTVAVGGSRSMLPTHVVGSPWRLYYAP